MLTTYLGGHSEKFVSCHNEISINSAIFAITGGIREWQYVLFTIQYEPYNSSSTAAAFTHHIAQVMIRSD